MMKSVCLGEFCMSRATCNIKGAYVPIRNLDIVTAARFYILKFARTPINCIEFYNLMSPLHTNDAHYRPHLYDKSASANIKQKSGLFIEIRCTYLTSSCSNYGFNSMKRLSVSLFP